MDVKIVNKSNHQLPSYATASSAGMDLKADILEPIVLKPMERYLFPTGICQRVMRHRFVREVVLLRSMELQSLMLQEPLNKK